MPSQKISNYMLTRKGEWSYGNVASEWGLDEPSFSNGAAYGDLDNDGDLDLVTNNVNPELFIYSNQSQEQKKNHFLAVSFQGVGTKCFWCRCVGGDFSRRKRNIPRTFSDPGISIEHGLPDGDRTW